MRRRGSGAKSTTLPSAVPAAAAWQGRQGRGYAQGRGAAPSSNRAHCMLLAAARLLAVAPALPTCQEAVLGCDGQRCDGPTAAVKPQHHLQAPGSGRAEQEGGELDGRRRHDAGSLAAAAAELAPTCRECIQRKVTRPLVPAARSMRPLGVGHRQASRS